MSAWSGTNGAKPGKTVSKASKEDDVQSYLQINDVRKLVNVALNSVAAERPADFRAALCTTLRKPDILSTAISKSATKDEAQKAKEYLDSNDAEALLAHALSQLAGTMPPNAAAELANFVEKAPAKIPAASAPAKQPKEDKPKNEKTAKASGEAKADDSKKEKAAPQAAAAAPPAPKKEDAPPAGVDKNKWKAAVKEGGKKGVELAGCADMGGLEFFTTQIEAAEGDIVLLQCAMDAANKEVDPKDEEAKGGSGMVGKMLLSSGLEQLGLLCYVPAEKKDKCDASEWMKAVLAPCNGEFIEGTELMAKGKVVADGQTRFTLKDKDTCQSASVEWLKGKGLFPQGDNEDDDWVPDEGAVEW